LNGANSEGSSDTGTGFGAGGLVFCTTGLGGVGTFFGTGGFFSAGGGGGAGFGGSATGFLGDGIAIIDTSMVKGFASVISSFGFIKPVNSHICTIDTNMPNKTSMLRGRSSPSKAAQLKCFVKVKPAIDSLDKAVSLFCKAPSLLLNENIKPLSAN
jgi:hypothetical protein